MILDVQWEKEFELIYTQTKWYSKRWERGEVTFSRIAGQTESLFETLSTTSGKRPHTEDQISPSKTRKEMQYGMDPRG